MYEKTIKAVMSGYSIIDKEGNSYTAPVGVRGLGVHVEVLVQDSKYYLFMFGRMFQLTKES